MLRLAYLRQTDIDTFIALIPLVMVIILAVFLRFKLYKKRGLRNHQSVDEKSSKPQKDVRKEMVMEQDDFKRYDEYNIKENKQESNIVDFNVTDAVAAEYIDGRRSLYELRGLYLRDEVTNAYEFFRELNEFFEITASVGIDSLERMIDSETEKKSKIRMGKFEFEPDYSSYSESIIVSGFDPNNFSNLWETDLTTLEKFIVDPYSVLPDMLSEIMISYGY